MRSRAAAALVLEARAPGARLIATDVYTDGRFERVGPCPQPPLGCSERPVSFVKASFSSIEILGTCNELSLQLSAQYGPVIPVFAENGPEFVIDDALIQRTPSTGVNLPRRSQVEKRFLGVEELHHIADTIDPRHRTVVLTASYTGARFGELAALQPQDLDLSRRRVTITRSLTEVPGVITETEPKTAASKRSITLPLAIADDLAAHLDQHATGPTDRVFTTPLRGPLRRRSFRTRFWLPAVDASVGQPMRFHDLRYTHAALLIAPNTHPKLLQSLLGHTSIKTTLDIYGRLYEIAAYRLEQLIADPNGHRTRSRALTNRPRNSEQPLLHRGC